MARDLRNSFCAGLFLSRDESEQPVYVDRRAAYQISNFAGPTRNYGHGDCGSQQHANPCHDISGGMGHGIHWKAVSIAEVANFVQNWTDRPVVDEPSLRCFSKVRISD